MREVADATEGILRKHYALVLVALTALAFISGVAYFHAYFAVLGFEGLVFSLPPDTYLATGGISLLIVLLFEATLAAGIFSVIESAAKAKWKAVRQPGRLRLALRRSLDAVTPLQLAFFAFLALLVPLAMPWVWLVPNWGIPGSGPILAGWVAVIWSLLALLSLLIALARLRGRALATFGVAVILSVSPGLAANVGKARADLLVKDPDSFTRVRVWPTNATEVPLGYVLVHQEDDLLYLVVHLPEDPPNGTKGGFRPSILRLADVHRVEFLPPGTRDES